MIAGERTITLTRRDRPTKNGDWVFRRPGVKASIYVNKRIFTTVLPPDTLTLSSDADEFRLPGNLDPEATSKRIDLLEERELRARMRAESQVHHADKLRTQAKVLHDKLDLLGQ